MHSKGKGNLGMPEPRGGGGKSHTLPIWVCAAQRGRDFEAPDLERGTLSEAFFRTGYNISNARKLQFCKQPFEIIQGRIAFTALFTNMRTLKFKGRLHNCVFRCRQS